MISDAVLLESRKADAGDLATLRRLEQSAIATIQKQTGRYYGIADAAFVEIIRFRGWPIHLANEPTGGVITSLEQWDGSAWSTVAAADYYLSGSFVWSNSMTGIPTLVVPTRYRATYPAGYAGTSPVWAAPADIQQAVLLLVGHWHENPEGVVVGEGSAEVPLGVQMLLAPHALASV